ncbi:hypothetical protein CALVIDRAFT_597733 [Calocera viscosa TUFC12733]|uniref:Uncharacterized protein n=1 Tax=Calocera viscosa (strain TUFC12733) TaxID=1330018 RepID=A0A167MRI3_CALVF|nr:hypothetical protein CALVIDRAFT_597733 [Calocera viscosa TUFC12733]
MRSSYLLSIATVLLASKACAAVVERQNCPLMCTLEFFADEVNPVKGDAAYEACLTAAESAYHSPTGACDPSCEVTTDPSGWDLIGVQGNGYTCID